MPFLPDQARRTVLPSLAVVLFSLGFPTGSSAQDSTNGWADSVPSPESVMGSTTSEMRNVVERYSSDRQALFRRYTIPYSPARNQRLHDFYDQWHVALRDMDFEALGVDGRIDYLLLDKDIRYQLELLEREEAQFLEMETLLPFALEIMDLEESRRRFEAVDPMAVAQALSSLETQVRETRGRIQSAKGSGEEVSSVLGLRAGLLLRRLTRTLGQWYGYHAGYDPLFSWWVQAPYSSAREALDAYSTFLRVEVVGQRPGEDEPIVGDPIGAEGMAGDLAYEMISYSPEELIAIGWREFEWCQAELRKAAAEMGYGDDRPAAMEEVKNLYVDPGLQPDLIRDLAFEAVEYVTERDLLTVPPLAEEIWRMEMMSPEAQRVSPFFLGGEVIQVSYPTDEMDHQDKLMSMRGNNPHFSRATVQHELIPGHWLQQFMYQRFNPHRSVFGTPFWIEGNSLYWEMLLWDLGFPRGPEDKIGMLFWRTHRAARIVFSLSFHLGLMTPEEAIDLLVERVGHEPATARAEVRRSFNGSYSPLYQAAYMLGGLQIRALREELVDSGQMGEKEFHDGLLLGGNLPIEFLRARLRGDLLPRDFQSEWRFAGDPGGSGR
jgi:uncharacterized protein (DUF885 family)